MYLSPERVFPELYILWLQFTRYPHKGRFFKNVMVSLAKSIDIDVDEELHRGVDAGEIPIYLLYEQVLPYPVEHLIPDYHHVDEDEREGALGFLLSECFTPTEVSEVVRALVTDPFPDDWGAHLGKERVTWPIPKNTYPYTWGPYNRYTSLRLKITETVWGYTYSVYDFEPEDRWLQKRLRGLEKQYG